MSGLVIAALAIIGRQNNPLYLQTFVQHDNALKFHFIVHSSLDVVEERVKKKNKGDKLDKYLGLLYPTEDYKVYGYVTNTNVKMIIVTTENANPKDPDLRMFFTNFHKLYVNAASNPFYESNTKIDSPSFVKALTTLATKGII